MIYLVGGFNPLFKKMCMSNWIVSPQKQGENKNVLNPSVWFIAKIAKQTRIIVLPTQTRHYF